MEFKGLKPKDERVAAEDRLRALETFDTPPAINNISMESDECTAICPVTSQPDYYTIHVEYVPREKCLESKSLKLYLGSFRNEGVFGEELASRIAHEIYGVLEAQAIRVSVYQKSRGGIAIRSIAALTREDNGS